MQVIVKNCQEILDMFCSGHISAAALNAVTKLTAWFVFLRSQAARGKEGVKDGVSEMGTRLDPVPGLPGGESETCKCVCNDIVM